VRGRTSRRERWREGRGGREKGRAYRRGTHGYPLLLLLVERDGGGVAQRSNLEEGHETWREGGREGGKGVSS
jgi:hypothetical protein